MIGLSSHRKMRYLVNLDRGGFSSKINYIDHLMDLNQIRIKNNQNKFFVYFLFFIKIIKKPIKFIKGMFSKYELKPYKPFIFLS